MTMSVILFLLKKMIYSHTHTNKAAGRTSSNLITDLMSKIINMQPGIFNRSLYDFTDPTEPLLPAPNLCQIVKWPG